MEVVYSVNTWALGVFQGRTKLLFSIIHAVGGHRDNPYVEQFKSSFKYVVADKLFVQIDASNCKVDKDKILLDVSNITMAKYVQSVPTSVEKPSGVDIAVIAPPP